MYKKYIFLLPLLLTNIKSESFSGIASDIKSMPGQMDYLNARAEKFKQEMQEHLLKRDQADIEWISAKIAEGKSYSDLLKEIHEHAKNPQIVYFLVLGLTCSMNQKIAEQSKELDKKELMISIAKDVAAIIASQNSSRLLNDKKIEMDELYEKETKPFLCNRIFANKREDQIAAEIKEAPSELMQTVIFGKAKHCDCIKEDWQDFLAKHNIKRKEN